MKDVIHFALKPFRAIEKSMMQQLLFRKIDLERLSIDWIYLKVGVHLRNLGNPIRPTLQLGETLHDDQIDHLCFFQVHGFIAAFLIQLLTYKLIG